MYAVKEGRKKRTGLFAAAVSVAAAAAAGLACIVFSWYRSRGSEKEFYSLFVLISMLFAAWSVLFLYQKHILEKKCRDLQESWNAQNAYGKALDQSRISMEKVRHDYKNIVISLRYLMDQKKYEDVRSLLGECYTRVEADKVESFCSIPALNGILLAKKEICRKENIEFDADFRIAKAEIDIPVHDLCLAAGNLLDNAIRACRRMEKTEKVIRMKGHVIQGYLIFECLNTCPDEKEGTIHGTGYGHQILQDLARQYGGSFTAGRKQKEIYQSTLLLKAGTRTRAESAG